jgi:acyl-CoA thioesterase FadM
LQPAFEKDALIVRTWVSDMKRSSSLRKYKILRGDELLAAAETNWVLVDARSRALARIPAEMSASFQVVNET